MEQLFIKKFFSKTCTLRGKNDVQLTFDDSYISYVSKLFARTCLLRGKKDVELNFNDSYFCYVSKIYVFLKFFCVSFH